MYNFFVAAINTIFANWQSFVIGGTIVVFTLISFVGILKPLLFDKIKCKSLRKSLLALTSIVLVLPFTAIWFVFKGFNFANYWLACGLYIPATIITYFLYENTNLRSLIHLIGSKTIYRWVVHFSKNIVKDDMFMKEHKTLSDYNSYEKLVANEIKKTADKLVTPEKDDDLKNL